MSAIELAAMRRDTGNAAHLVWLRATLCVPSTRENALVVAYIELHKKAKWAALALSRARGVNYDAQTVNAWRRGEVPVPGKVKDAMRVAILSSRFPNGLTRTFLELLDIEPIGFEESDAVIR